MPKERPRKRRNHIHNTQCQDALNRSRHNPEGKRLGVVFVPGLDVEGQEGGEEDEDCRPALAERHGAGEEEDFEGRVEGVDAWWEGGG